MIEYIQNAQAEIIGTAIAAILVTMSKKIYTLTTTHKENSKLIEMHNQQIYTQNQEIQSFKLTNNKLQSVIQTQNAYIEEQRVLIRQLKSQLAAEQEKSKNISQFKTQNRQIRSHKNILTIGQTEIVSFLNTQYGQPADTKDWLAWPANTKTNKIMLEKIVDNDIIIRFSFKRSLANQTLNFLKQRNYKHWEDKGGSGKNHMRYHVCFPLDITQMDIHMLKMLIQNCI